MKLLKLGIIAIAAPIVLGAVINPSYAAPKANQSKPLNAGKDGIKSNAGAGNGTEKGGIVSSATSDPTYSNIGGIYLVPIEGSTVSVYETLPQATTTVTKTPVGEPFHAGNSQNSALKQSFSVTTTTTSWNGEKWVETTQTEIMQDVIKTVIVTDTYVDLDPGRSGQHNKSPEGSTVVETTAVETEETLVLGVGDPIIEEKGEFTPTTSSSNQTVIENYSPNCQGVGC